MHQTLFVFLALFAAASTGAIADGPNVTTQFGTVIGHNGTGFLAYYAIPYAEPPIGNLRWARPVAWSKNFTNDVFNASINFRLSCMNAKAVAHNETISEDCLVLNIWTPSRSVIAANGGKLPVLFFIHGGSYVQGSGASMYNQPEHLVQTSTPIVVVNVNYRLGAFGFLGMNETLAESNTTGNWGLLDQRLAMYWVRDNIAVFGGDPSQVTIGGQSAGAQSVVLHLAMPKSRGLYVRAIGESAYLSWINTLSASVSYGATVTAHFNCTNSVSAEMLACMRNISAGDLLAYAPGGLFGTALAATYDGIELTSAMTYKLVAAADMSHVPMLFGTTHDEGTLFAYTISSISTIPQQYAVSAVKSLLEYVGFGSYLKNAMLWYPSHTGDNMDLLSNIITDAAFYCINRQVLRAQSYYVSSIYQYRFDKVPYCTSSDKIRQKVMHGAELLYLFDRSNITGCIANDTYADMHLSNETREYWSSFVSTGVPSSSSSGVSWPKWNTTTESTIILNAPKISVGSKSKQALCNFWDSAYSGVNGSLIICAQYVNRDWCTAMGCTWTQNVNSTSASCSGKPAVSSLSTCGNSNIDTNETCDGGYWCDNTCNCMNSSISGGSLNSCTCSSTTLSAATAYASLSASSISAGVVSITARLPQSSSTRSSVSMLLGSSVSVPVEQYPCFFQTNSQWSFGYLVQQANPGSSSDGETTKAKFSLLTSWEESDYTFSSNINVTVVATHSLYLGTVPVVSDQTQLWAYVLQSDLELSLTSSNYATIPVDVVFYSLSGLDFNKTSFAITSMSNNIVAVTTPLFVGKFATGAQEYSLYSMNVSVFKPMLCSLGADDEFTLAYSLGSSKSGTIDFTLAGLESMCTIEEVDTPLHSQQFTFNETSTSIHSFAFNVGQWVHVLQNLNSALNQTSHSVSLSGSGHKSGALQISGTTPSYGFEWEDCSHTSRRTVSSKSLCYKFQLVAGSFNPMGTLIISTYIGLPSETVSVSSAIVILNETASESSAHTTVSSAAVVSSAAPVASSTSPESSVETATVASSSEKTTSAESSEKTATITSATASAWSLTSSADETPSSTPVTPSSSVDHVAAASTFALPLEAIMLLAALTL